MTEEQDNKDAAFAGVLLTSFFITGIVVLMFLWAPVAHYLGKWNDFWETKPSSMSQEDRQEWNAWGEAASNCTDRAMAYWGVSDEEVITHTVDTSSTTPYATSDCYGIKLTKLAPSSL